MVAELLKSPSAINVNYVDGLGCTALHYASKTESLDCLRLLAKVPGINLDIQDNMERDTALHKVLRHSDETETALEVVKLLVAAGANPSIKNKQDQRPIDMLQSGEEDIELVLVQAAYAHSQRRNMPKGDQSSDDGGDGPCSSDEE